MTDEQMFNGWRKASFSSGGDNCVEVGFSSDGRVGIRDTEMDGYGPMLVFRSDEWTAFVQGVKEGEFDGR